MITWHDPVLKKIRVHAHITHSLRSIDRKQTCKRMCVAHARTVVVVKTRLNNLADDEKYVGHLTLYYFGVEHFDKEDTGYSSIVKYLVN